MIFSRSRHFSQGLVLRRLLMALCVAVACASFAPTRARAAGGLFVVDVNGQKRTATVLERSRLKRAPRTTIIVLRGGESRARRSGLSRVDRFLGLDTFAGAGIVLAFPTAVDSRWSIDGGKADDVAFVRALATRLVAEGVADKRRIFIAGVSSGGVMALRILCDGGDYLSGGAVMIANLPTDLAASCKPSRPRAMFMLNGTADPLMPYQGGPAKLADFKGDVVSVDDTLAPFLAANDCGKTRTSQDVADKDKNDGSRVVIERPVGCKAPIEIFRVDGGGHSLPGRPIRADRGAAIGARNNDIDTARALIDFVRRAAR